MLLPARGPKKKLWVNGKMEITAGLLAVGLLLGTSAWAQDEKAAGAGTPTGKKETVVTKPRKKTAGNDSNIKSNSDENNPNVQTPAPPKKGGSRTQGGGSSPCGLHIDNRTPWLMRIYVDGNYRGTVSAYADLVGIMGKGPSTLYAVAVFNDGSEKTWGPRVFNCSAGDVYTWQVTDWEQPGREGEKPGREAGSEGAMPGEKPGSEGATPGEKPPPPKEPPGAGRSMEKNTYQLLSNP